MKTTLLITLMFLFAAPIQEQDKLLGTWKMAENNTRIEIAKEGDRYQGTVVESDVAEAIGKVVLQDFKREGEVWTGKFYAARRDRLVDATLKDSGEDALEMEIKAGRRSKTLNLTKAE